MTKKAEPPAHGVKALSEAALPGCGEPDRPPVMKGRKGRPGNIALAALSGLLLGAAFPPVPTGITAFAALLPLLFLLERLEDYGQTFRFSYLSFLVFNISAIWWVSGWWGDDVWLKAAGVAVNLVHPLLFTIPILFYRFLRETLGLSTSLAVFPFLWAAYEYVAHLPELSFPWLLLGNSQTYEITKIQFIRYTGVFGASFWIVSANVLLFIIARKIIHGGFSRKSAALLCSSAALLLALPEIDGRLELASEAPARTIKVGIVQPDTDPYEKWGAGESPMSKLISLAALYDSLSAAENPDLVLWPETATPFYLLQPSHQEEWRWLRRRIDSADTPLLTGFPDLRWYESDAPASARKLPEENIWYQSFNASLLVLPNDNRIQIYHKSRLTPMSERIPYLDALPFLQDALTWGVGISNWGLGNDTTVFLVSENPAIRTWAMICYETLYPSFVAGFAERGADFFCVITNDGWFGNSSGPYQLKQYAVLRAIENRRSIARCANNGISCLIDPYGRVTNETDFETRTAFAGHLSLRSDITFYALNGDWFPKLCLIVCFAAMLAAMTRKFRRKR